MKKSAWGAALLNLFLPGAGFMYIGTDAMIGGGMLLLMASIGEAAVSLSGTDKAGSAAFLGSAVMWVGLVSAVAMAILGAAAAELNNRMVDKEAQLAAQSQAAAPQQEPAPAFQSVAQVCAASIPAPASAALSPVGPAAVRPPMVYTAAMPAQAFAPAPQTQQPACQPGSAVMRGQDEPTSPVPQPMAQVTTPEGSGQAPEAVVAQRSFCGACGNPMKPGARFCVKCGTAA